MVCVCVCFRREGSVVFWNILDPEVCCWFFRGDSCYSEYIKEFFSSEQKWN